MSLITLRLNAASVRASRPDLSDVLSFYHLTLCGAFIPNLLMYLGS